MSEVSAGDIVGDYTLEAPLDEGGQGYIWRARHAGTGALVVLKILTKPNSQGEIGLMRREIEMLAATAANRSPHIVRVLGGAAEPVPYIVMEFVDGSDLRKELERLNRLHGGVLGRFSQMDAIQVGIAVADALAALHGEGIIHRDVKPANVMMDRRGNIKLTDFGIAKIVGTSAVTVASEHPLSLHYAAPEVWDGQAVPQSDIYALGVTLFELLTGTPPFQGTTTALYRKHVSEPPDMDSLPPDTAPGLVALISVCMAKAATYRPSAAECRDTLTQLKNELARQADTAPLQSHEPEYLGVWRRLTPHPQLPWAWQGRHRDSSEEAVVELHFASDLQALEQQVSQARRALEANPRLVPLGAERLLAVDRFLLGPNEAWSQTPPGHFSYLVARAEQPVPQAPARVTSELLRAAAVSLSALVDAARREGLLLNLSPEELSLSGDGHVRLRHPGLNAQDGPTMDAAALSYLHNLPLEADARAALTGAASLHDVISRLTPASEAYENATMLVDRRQMAPGNETVIVRPDQAYETQVFRPAATAEATAAWSAAQQGSITAELRPVKTATRFGAARFEMMVRNNAGQEQRVRLRPEGDVKVSVLDTIVLGPGQTRLIPFTVQPRSTRLFGGPIERVFDVAVSGDLGGQVETYSGAFRDESRPWLPLGAAAMAAVIGIFVALMLAGGGGGGSGSNTAASATNARTHVAAFEFKEALSDFNDAIKRTPNDAALFAGRARVHLNLADFTSALADAGKAIELNPSNAEAYYVKSIVASELWHYEDAVAAATKAIELEPTNATYYAIRSEIYGDREPAKQAPDAAKALELDPNNAEAHAAMASVYSTQKKYNDAYAEYTKAITLQPKNGLLYVSRAMVSYRGEDYETTLSRLNGDRQVIASYPLSNAEGEMGRGIAHHGAGRYPEAIAQFNKAHDIIDDWAAYYYWHGFTYYNQKDFTTALRDYAKAIELAPTEPATYLARGFINRDQNKLDAAVSDINRAISLNPASADYLTERAYIYYLQNNYDPAVADCTKAIELDPSYYSAYHIRSLVRESQKRYNEALVDANKTIELRPKDPALLSNRGYILYELDNYPAALADLTASLTIRPTADGTYNLRGNVYYAQRNYQAAIEDYNKAIQYDGNNAQFYLNRGSAYENLNRKTEARADYEKGRAVASTPELKQRAQTALDSMR
jgi:tetratricopeptide (TPR) repeat protein/serine/threonine protein kinase